MQFFDKNGRRISGDGDRVYGSTPSFYYKLNQPEIDYELILDRSKLFNFVPQELTSVDFKSKAEVLLEKIKTNDAYANILKGVKIPFVTRRKVRGADLGEELQSDLLPSLSKSFKARFPEAHFKAVFQSSSKLSDNVSLASGSNYHDLISAAEAGTVVGWYFPQAVQEFDVESQRSQMMKLPEIEGAKVCLSGGIDICAAVSSHPELLISDQFYSPILCLSAYIHKDPRLVLLLKSYGPHLEFWCMTQMLTKETTQVSEQWAGGITIFLQDTFK